MAAACMGMILYCLFATMVMVSAAPAAMYEAPELTSFIDISKACNMDLQDEKMEDRKGGWMDQGSNDLAYLPIGNQTFAGVPFEIIDPAKNNGKAAIVLKGKSRDYFPEKTNWIPVNKQADRLYVLHGVAWANPSSEPYAKMLVKYTDGKAVAVPFRIGQEANDWHKSQAASNGPLAWIGRNDVQAPIALHLLAWKNPRPEEFIHSIRFVSMGQTPAPGFLAVTAASREFPLTQPSHVLRNQSPLQQQVTYRMHIPLCHTFSSAGKREITVYRNLPAKARDVQRLRVWLRFADLGKGGQATVSIGDKAVTKTIGPEDWTAAFDFVERSILTNVRGKYTKIPIMVTLTGDLRLGVYEYDTSPNVRWAPGGQDEENLLYAVTLDTKFRTPNAKLALWRNLQLPPQPRKAPEAEEQNVTAKEQKAPESIRLSLCLNGVWQLASSDPKTRPQTYPAAVRVPGIWSISKGLSEKDQETHCLWYRTTFQVPAGVAADKRLKLKFDMVAYKAAVYVNGVEVGGHLGDIDDFTLDITEAVRREGENELLVRVEDHHNYFKPGPEGKRVPDRIVNRLEHHPDNKNMEFWSGIVGDVYLQALPKATIDDVYVRPSVREKKLYVSTELKGDVEAMGGTISHSVLAEDGKEVLRLPDAEAASTKKEPLRTQADWADARLWDLNDPYMYTLRTEWRDANGKLIDSISTPFGFREFWVEGTEFVLNGRKVRLQGDSPNVNNYRIPCRNHLQQQLMFQWYKYMNCNLTRLHLTGMNDPEFVNAADQAGMLVTLEAPHIKWEWIYDEKNNKIQWERLGEIKRQYKRWARRFRNHPSVVMYSIYNEFWSRESDDPKEIKTRTERLKVLHVLHDIMAAEDPDAFPQLHGCEGYRQHGIPWGKVTNMHYQWADHHTKNWKQDMKNRPLIIGEIAFEGTWTFFHSELENRKRKKQDYMDYYWQKLSTVVNRITGYIDLYRFREISGIMPYEIIRWTVDPDDPRGLANDTPKLEYPALSGPGQKPDRSQNTQMRYMNWFNPALPKAPQNMVSDAITDHFAPQPLPDFRYRQKEIIIRVLRKGRPVANVSVVLYPADGQPASPLGSVTDNDGKSWIVLPEGGTYTAVLTLKGKTLRLDVQPDLPREFSRIKTVTVETEPQE
ncbi:MAG: beta galactosidase jelly roll domain-containing protein [Phycisphaerae bacterium]|nr:beta galactosidase jelly roll domain-containing protein [Phycisphaerae bacterium]